MKTYLTKMDIPERIEELGNNLDKKEDRMEYDILKQLQQSSKEVEVVDIEQYKKSIMDLGFPYPKILDLMQQQGFIILKQK